MNVFDCGIRTPRSLKMADKMEVDGATGGGKKDGEVEKKIVIDDNPENEGAFMKLSALRFRLARSAPSQHWNIPTRSLAKGFARGCPGARCSRDQSGGTCHVAANRSHRRAGAVVCCEIGVFLIAAQTVFRSKLRR
jgi:hypothetical protein